MLIAKQSLATRLKQSFWGNRANDYDNVRDAAPFSKGDGGYFFPFCVRATGPKTGAAMSSESRRLQ